MSNDKRQHAGRGGELEFIERVFRSSRTGNRLFCAALTAIVAACYAAPVGAELALWWALVTCLLSVWLYWEFRGADKCVLAAGSGRRRTPARARRAAPMSKSTEDHIRTYADVLLMNPDDLSYKFYGKPFTRRGGADGREFITEGEAAGILSYLDEQAMFLKEDE